ncbi:MAG: hypothetical protein ACR2H3_05435 [Acidimicrobiales bacterium]
MEIIYKTAAAVGRGYCPGSFDSFDAECAVCGLDSGHDDWGRVGLHVGPPWPAEVVLETKLGRQTTFYAVNAPACPGIIMIQPIEWIGVDRWFLIHAPSGVLLQPVPEALPIDEAISICGGMAAITDWQCQPHHLFQDVEVIRAAFALFGVGLRDDFTLDVDDEECDRQSEALSEAILEDIHRQIGELFGEEDST